MLSFKSGHALVMATLAAVLAAPTFAQEASPRQQAFRRIYQELVEINTTNSAGDSVRAAEAMAAHSRPRVSPPTMCR